MSSSTLTTRVRICLSVWAPAITPRSISSLFWCYLQGASESDSIVFDFTSDTLTSSTVSAAIG